MSAVSRSKSGCWTCRLRRKKCLEGGPPCSNCESRGIFCHGYGPKPDWKDRGDKEREEANRLQLQSRRRHSRSHSTSLCGDASRRPTSATSSDGPTALDLRSPILTDFSFSLSPSHDHPEFDFLDAMELVPGSTGVDAFSDDLWPASSAAETLVELDHFQAPAPDPKQSAGLCFPFLGAGTAGQQVSEREIDLAMSFIEGTYAMQHDSCLTSSTKQRGWLLFLLMRSPTFYNASLSMSAYQSFLSVTRDSDARGVSFQEYQKYRTSALASFSQLLDASSGSSCSLLGESLICGVQIAHLEALGKNMQECQSYLSSAAKYLLDHEDLVTRNPSSSATMSLAAIATLPLTPTASSLTMTRPSLMESKALKASCAVLIWNDVLSCSTQRKAPVAVDAYRNLLLNESFSPTFQDVTGCESWVLLAILDATILEVWKRDQGAHGNLSIRELVSRADKIESVVEQGIKRLSQAPAVNHAPSLADNGHRFRHAQTNIFAHSVLIDLHAIISGPCAGVPEIKQSIDHSIEAWKLWPSSASPKSLAWPYCVSASLATGTQRDVFRELIAQLPTTDPGLGNLHGLKSVVEKCWSAIDRRGSHGDTSYDYDWKDVMQRSNLSLLFT